MQVNRAERNCREIDLQESAVRGCGECIVKGEGQALGEIPP